MSFSTHQCPLTRLVEIPTQRGARVCVWSAACVHAHALVCAKRERNDLMPSQISGILFSELLKGFQGGAKKLMDFSFISHRKSIISSCVVWLTKYLRHKKTPLVEISEMIYCSPRSETRSQYVRTQTQMYTDLSIHVNRYMYMPPLILPALVI